MNDNFIALLGQSEEDVCAYLSQKYPTCKYKLNYTCSPFLRDKDKKEQLHKKVIRIQNTNGILDILIAHFDQPSY